MNTVTVSYLDIALICLAAAAVGQIVLLAALAFCMGCRCSPAASKRGG